MFTGSESKRHQVRDAAREAVDRGVEGASELGRRVEETASDAAEAMRDSARSVRRKTGDAYGDLADLVQEHPVATIAIALVAGALLASLLKR